LLKLIIERYGDGKIERGRPRIHFTDYERHGHR